MAETIRTLMRERVRGLLPVVVDLETGGFNCRTEALLEIAAAEDGDGGRQQRGNVDASVEQGQADV